MTGVLLRAISVLHLTGRDISRGHRPTSPCLSTPRRPLLLLRRHGRFRRAFRFASRWNRSSLSSTGPPSASWLARGEPLGDHRREGRQPSLVEGDLADGRRLLLDARLPAGHRAARRGRVAPIATVILVLVTLLGALPVYAQVAGRCYAGQGSIAMLENLLAGWKGKLLVLVLLGFAATDFVITMTLSAADAAKHAVENPFLQPVARRAPGPGDAAILAVLAAVFLKGFREAIGLAAAVAVPYLRSTSSCSGAGLGDRHAPRRSSRAGARARRARRVRDAGRGARPGVPEARAGPERVRDRRLRHAADRRRRAGPRPRPAPGGAPQGRVAQHAEAAADGGR